MSENLIEVTPSAYDYPLLIKHLLHSPLTHRRIRRSSTAICGTRTGSSATDRAAGERTVADLGVKAGDVVAVLDWDSHRYHECYFAMPMMGAVLQTVNLSLPPEQLPLRDERHRRHDLAAQCRLPAADREAGGQAAGGAEIRPAARPAGAADDDVCRSKANTRR